MHCVYGGVLRGSCTMCMYRGVVRAAQGLERVWSVGGACSVCMVDVRKAGC